MTSLRLLVLNIFWFLYCAFTITNADLINRLPGQPSDLNFNQYSGYIVTDDYHGRAQFYYFVEAQSKNKLSFPLTLWLGGAYGCSSFGVGVFAENGPFRPGKDGNLTKNDFSWNLASNMLYVDSPIGTSFSYSNSTSDYKHWTDTNTANENMKFLLKWFEKFPEYSNLDFYIAGDSYGGHLVPQLATKVLEYNTKPHVRPIKLKAIAIGNPFLDIRISLSGVENMWHRGMISEEMVSMQKSVCSMARYYTEYASGKRTKACHDMMLKLLQENGDELDVDDMLMPICLTTDDNSSSSPQHYYRGGASETSIHDPCIYDNVKAYLTKPDVHRALHVAPLPFHWDTECTGLANQRTPQFEINIIPTLSLLLRRHLPVLLYSGDQDLMVPVAQTRKIAYMLARDLKLTTLHKNGPWYDGHQIGGWSQTFGKSRRGKNMTYLTFATIKGGSHYAPNTSPSEALILFKSFLKGSSLPRRFI